MEVGVSVLCRGPTRLRGALQEQPLLVSVLDDVHHGGGIDSSCGWLRDLPIALLQPNIVALLDETELLKCTRFGSGRRPGMHQSHMRLYGSPSPGTS